MEVAVQTDINNKKVYKTKECVRNCMKRYENKLRLKNDEQYLKRLQYHKDYYRKKKEQLLHYKQLLEQNNIKIE